MLAIICLCLQTPLTTSFGAADAESAKYSMMHRSPSLLSHRAGLDLQCPL
jgi:hypothetical protein